MACLFPSGMKSCECMDWPVLGQTTTWGVGVKTLHAAIFSDTIKSEQCQLCVMIPLTEVYLFTPHSLSLPVHIALTEFTCSHPTHRGLPFTLHSLSLPVHTSLTQFTCSHPTHRTLRVYTPFTEFTCLHPTHWGYLFSPHSPRFTEFTPQSLSLPVHIPLTEVYVFTPQSLPSHTPVTPKSHPSHPLS